ncbi:tetratricopeptide repeat protein [Actinomadura scrupuli]|uniref:tetratricopeptide repeat protein n=1 Tax=Actinomadura scrupuli TaxID=559629 RepID=UPI003D95E833
MVVVGLALLATVPGLPVAFKITNPWVVASAGFVAAVVVAVAAVWQERYKRLAQRRDEETLKIQEGCLVLPDGALPKVRELADPIVLGVHPAAIVAPSVPVSERLQDRVPAYIPRDVDDELRRRLEVSGFVLVVGDSTAGKSRAAYEAMRTMLPDHTLIAPKNREVLAAAIGRATATRRCVVWLNDLEIYLEGGLSRADIGRLLGGDHHHRIILATLRSAEEHRFTGEGGRDQRQARKDAQETLEQAHRIPLARMFSAAERERARTRDWDPRVADALNFAGEYGIAEYIAAGPELLRDWENAWSPNTDPHAPSHPRAAALITAAVDLRCAGYTSPLPRGLLEQVHEHYLAERGGLRLRPEPLDEAWQWATGARRATTALLQPHDDHHVHVFDYLVDTIQKRALPGDQVPEDVLRTALEACPPGDADNIAATAYDQGRFELAETAWRTASQPRTDDGDEHPAELTSRNNLARALRRLGRFEEAEAAHQAVVRARTRLLGPDHPDTLISRDNRANVLRDLGRYTEAESEHRAVLEICLRVLGPEHPYTLFSRDNRAHALRCLGRFQEAMAEHQMVVRIRTRLLGPDHPDTLISRDHLANALRGLGRYEEAEQEIRTVLQTRIRILGPDHPYTVASRTHHAEAQRELARSETRRQPDL